MNSGDGWQACDRGHRHWGLFGAAGLLIHDGDRVLLQHRSPWTHEGDTWGIVGGARDLHESPVEAALREASEEAGIRASDVEPLGLLIDDHGGWSYSTVIATPLTRLDPQPANDESLELRWVPVGAVPALKLHTGFAAAWPALAPRPIRLLISAPPALLESPALARLCRDGVAVAGVPCGELPIDRLFPALRSTADPVVAVTDTIAVTITSEEELLALAAR